MTRKQDHRRPDRPPFYESARPGWCRMCGEPIVEGGMIQSRRRWHHLCLVRWKVMSVPAVTRRFLWNRDKGKCCDCGEVTEDWECDHEVPLRLATKPEHWQPGNLKTRCKLCHKSKTRRDWAKIMEARKG